MQQDGAIYVRNPGLVDALLADRDLSKSDVARLISVNRGTVSQILNGRIPCEAERAQAIAAAFGSPSLAPDILFTGMPSGVSTGHHETATTDPCHNMPVVTP